MYTSFTVNRITKGSGLYELAVLSHVVTMVTSLVMGCVAIVIAKII